MGSRNRFKNRIAKTKDSNLSRKELIQKYGLSTFREDPVEQAALNKSKPSPDFSKDPKYASTGGPNGNKFIGEKNTTGGTGAKSGTTPRRQNFKMRLGYPLARGSGERTGDTLLIKCLEYQAPEGGVSGLGLSGIRETGIVTAENGGTYKGKNVTNGQVVTTGYRDVKMNVTDANARMSRNQKIKYYVELPIPQEVSDSNTVTWGEDQMNIFQLAGITAASQFQADAGGTFQQALDFIQKGIKFDGFDEGTQNAIRNAISGKAINQLGGNVSMSGIISRTTGQVLNSNLELLFGGVNLRSFPFSVTFTPRYYEEMIEVKRIIRQLKS